MLTLAAAVAAWTFQIKTDPMTDAGIAMATALDSEGKVAVSLRCEDKGSGNFVLYAKSSAWLGGGRYPQQARNIQYRIDDGMSSLLTGIYRADEVAVLPAYELNRFVRGAASAKSRIILRFETYSGAYLDAILPANGSATAIRKLTDFCSQP